MMEWGCCTLAEADGHYIQCGQCKVAYHYACLFPNSNQETVSDRWICPSCLQKVSKGGKNDSTPVRVSDNITFRKKKVTQATTLSANNSSVTREEVRNIMEDLFEKYITSFMKEIGEMHSELKNVTSELEHVMNSMTHMNENFEDVMKEHKVLTEKVGSLEAQQTVANSTIVNLQLRVNQLEQQARCKNVEIQCLPEKKSEDLISIVKNISNLININLKDENIIRATRVSKLNPNNTRPRSIVVEFNTPMIRDTFLAASIDFNKKNSENKLNTHHLGVAGPKSAIYIAEHLSSDNKSLHAATRKFAKEKNYKFVWVRGGRIYLRKNEESKYILVKDIGSLKNIK